MNPGKRIFDLILAAVLLIVLALPLLALALAVAVFMGRPVLFVQERPGLHGRPFRLVKFRSMRDAVDAQGRPFADAERLTAFGRLLRRTSLDELPELWNVLKGDMSLVGPRPLLMEYLPHYSAEQMRRHDVRPGITGWAQVNGRNDLGWEELFELDLWYVDNQSLALDLKILFMTAKAVLTGAGVNQRGFATRQKFRDMES